MTNKEPKEKATPCLCVCKKEPITVKMKGKYLYTCPDHQNCAMRSIWCSKEQEAIQSWNTAVSEARHRKEKGNA